MIESLSFTRALVLFTIILTPIFLGLISLSDKFEKKDHKRFHSDLFSEALLIGSILTGLTAVILLNFHGFWKTSAYFILILLTVSLLLCFLRSASTSPKFWKLALCSAVIYHIALLYYSPFTVHINEQFPAWLRLIQEGHWHTSMGLHYAYDPFPFGLSLFGFTSMVTSAPFISTLPFWALNFSLIIAFDLIIYSLVRRVAKSDLIAILAVLIFASTPITNLIAHHAKWPGMLLALVSLLALLKAYEGSSPRCNVILAIISYTAAIYFYPTSAIVSFFFLAIPVIGLLAKGFFKEKSWKEVSKDPLFRTAFILFLVITFTRAIYTEGYLEAILPNLRRFVMTMFGTSSQVGMPPLYERSGANPTYAFSWSLPVAMGAALVIHSFIKRKAIGGEFTLAMIFTGAFFLVLGFLSSTVLAGKFGVNLYPCYAFIVPAAGVLGGKVLKCPSKILPTALIAILVVSAGIAVHDPMLSPATYCTLKEERGLPTTPDYVEAQTLSPALHNSSWRRLMTSKEIKVPLRFISSSEGRNLPNLPVKSTYEKLKHSLLKGEVFQKTIYIGPPNFFSNVPSSSFNRLYTSRRHGVIIGKGK